MRRDTPEGQLLTEYEARLDEFHRTLSLWTRPRPPARFALLAAFDLLNAVVPLSIAATSPRPFVVQKVKWLHDALMYALQFLWREERSAATAVPCGPPIIEEAAEFLKHCQDYSTLADFHMGFGRGMYTLEADPDERRIRFVPNPVPGAAPDPLGILEDHHKLWGQVDQVFQTRELGRMVEFFAAEDPEPEHPGGGSRRTCRPSLPPFGDGIVRKLGRANTSAPPPTAGEPGFGLSPAP